MKGHEIMTQKWKRKSSPPPWFEPSVLPMSYTDPFVDLLPNIVSQSNFYYVHETDKWSKEWKTTLRSLLSLCPPLIRSDDLKFPLNMQQQQHWSKQKGEWKLTKQDREEKIKIKSWKQRDQKQKSAKQIQ